MNTTKSDTTPLRQLLKNVGTVLQKSEWTAEIVDEPPEATYIVTGKWTAETALKLARHYGETIDSSEAKERAENTNKYFLRQGRHAIEIAAWTACSNRIRLLWQDKSISYEQKHKQTERFEAKKYLTYNKASCKILKLQINDTILKIERVELSGVEYFQKYYVTRLASEQGNVRRRVAIYSHGTLQNVFSTSKLVEIDGGDLTDRLVRLLPKEALDHESVVHRLAMGFAPSDEVFEVWIQEQLESLRERYATHVPVDKLEKLLEDLRAQASKAKEQREKNNDSEHISAKDIAHFNTLLADELENEN